MKILNGPLPWTISPGSSKTVLIGHEPYDELTDSGFIEVISNDPVTPVERADQIADGDFALNLIDGYEQDEVDKCRYTICYRQLRLNGCVAKQRLLIILIHS